MLKGDSEVWVDLNREGRKAVGEGDLHPKGRNQKDNWGRGSHEGLSVRMRVTTVPAGGFSLCQQS